MLQGSSRDLRGIRARKSCVVVSRFLDCFFYQKGGKTQALIVSGWMDNRLQVSELNARAPMVLSLELLFRRIFKMPFPDCLRLNPESKFVALVDAVRT
jgi:hypothetical protein